MTTGALFDLDGVVIDSESAYTECWKEIEERFPTGIDNFAIKIKGSTLPKILDTYFPDRQVQEEIGKMIVDYERNMRYVPFPEAIRFIEELIA